MSDWSCRRVHQLVMLDDGAAPLSVIETDYFIPGQVAAYMVAHVLLFQPIVGRQQPDGDSPGTSHVNARCTSTWDRAWDAPGTWHLAPGTWHLARRDVAPGTSRRCGFYYRPHRGTCGASRVMAVRCASTRSTLRRWKTGTSHVSPRINTPTEMACYIGETRDMLSYGGW
jgi:hypothetical protein